VRMRTPASARARTSEQTPKARPAGLISGIGAGRRVRSHERRRSRPPEPTGWHPAQPNSGKSIMCFTAFAPYQRNSPLRDPFAEILPIRVTLDPFYCTLAIEACRKR
jgi:hypothetical protein